MDTSSLLTALVKAVSRHSLEIDGLAHVARASAKIIEKGLPRCIEANCKNAATVKYATNDDWQCCDSCASRNIVLRGALEDAWIDLQNASHIRLLQDYLIEVDRHSREEQTPDDVERFH